MNHEYRLVIDDFSFLVSNSTRDSISSRTVSALDFFRISRNRRIVVKTKIEETSIAQLVIEKNENELMNENDDELSDCVKCCHVLVSCRRLADVACARSAKEKQTCTSSNVTDYQRTVSMTASSFSISSDTRSVTTLRELSDKQKKKHKFNLLNHQYQKKYIDRINNDIMRMQNVIKLFARMDFLSNKLFAESRRMLQTLSARYQLSDAKVKKQLHETLTRSMTETSTNHLSRVYDENDSIRRRFDQETLQ
jgi:hypothetical protein